MLTIFPRWESSNAMVGKIQIAPMWIYGHIVSLRSAEWTDKCREVKIYDEQICTKR